jgi:hypothetical protein
MGGIVRGTGASRRVSAGPTLQAICLELRKAGRTAKRGSPAVSRDYQSVSTATIAFPLLTRRAGNLITRAGSRGM